MRHEWEPMTRFCKNCGEPAQILTSPNGEICLGRNDMDPNAKREAREDKAEELEMEEMEAEELEFEADEEVEEKIELEGEK